MTDAFVLGGVRTPVGRYGGSLSHIRTDDLLGQTMVWACERVGVDAGPDRGHRRGLRERRARGDGRYRALGGAGRGLSGFGPGGDGQPLLRVVADVHDPDRARDPRRRARRRARRRGRVDVPLGLGYMKGDAPFMPRGPVLLLDTMWAGAGGPPNPNLLARDAYIDMMKTAQNVADRYELTREEIDAFALRSHQHAAAARDSGRLAKEIHPVEIPGDPQAARAHVRARREHPRRHDGGEARRAPGAAEHNPDDGR